VRYTQLTVKNVSQFIESVGALKKQWAAKDDSWGLWYRGHRKACWPLLPKLYRELAAGDNARESDDEIREDFIRRALSLTHRKPDNPWEWYFLMQHYGVPTRLLDWTESALVGLYFAIKNNQGYHDAAVWVLDPWVLNKRVVGREEVLLRGRRGSPSLIGVATRGGCSTDSNPKLDGQHRRLRSIPTTSTGGLLPKNPVSPFTGRAGQSWRHY
jgi:hypothetical protein